MEVATLFARETVLWKGRTMTSNRQLVDHMMAYGALRSSSIVEAFLRCDRVDFVPMQLYQEAYQDHPLPIGEGQTISQPSTVAIMLELLNPQVGNRVLDIGSGSGWTTALLAHIVGKDGFVEGVERVPYLVDYGRRSLSKAHVSNASIESAKEGILGKPGRLYDRILVSASAADVPTSLFDQLKDGGVLVAPVLSSVWRFRKEKYGTLKAYEFPGFTFVPLIVS
jgi:protein-L-isoaspartate(D-aspartate) O-methyltransferase